ncbi:MAG TPA: zinc-binding dehydrogenase [Candidatus Binatia bacterium]|nr:zinc-binding dehydrogenase [Candidatus Binatia bacterium]
MKAVRIHEHGGIDKLRYEEAPQPELVSPDDAIVEVKAASLNPTDLRVRRGAFGAEVSFPHILGSDGAGVVVAVGERVKNVKLGEPVCLYPVSGCGGCELCISDREFMCADLRCLGERENGTYAEYVRIPARNCFSIPSELSFEQAAALPLAFLTAWRMLVTNAELKPGETLLVLEMSGGATSAALQVAAHLGARVIVAAETGRNLVRAKEMGAEHVIDYRNADFTREVRQITGKRGVDVAVDFMGGETWAKSIAALAKGGRLVVCGATAGANPESDIRRLFWNHLKIFGSTLGSRAEFRQLLNFMETSRAKPAIDQSFPLAQAAAAQQILEEGEPFGKTVLRMGE